MIKLKTKLKQIKKTLKSHKCWQNYKHKFPSRKMRLLVTKIILIFWPEEQMHILVEIEKKLTQAPKNPQMYVETFTTLFKPNLTKVDWVSLSYFLFYINQATSYFKDKRKRNFNIFNQGNYLQANEQKRKYWYKWMNSLEKNDHHFNEHLKMVLKLVK